MPTFTIGVVGEISTGKSAFINSLLGYPVILSRLKRDTLCCTEYIFDPSCKGYPKYEPSVDTDELLQKPVPDTWHNKSYKISIIDFPGLNDTKDYREHFERNIKHCNLVIFVTNADRPLLTESETKLFKYVKETVGKITTHITQLCIVVNKFDNNDAEITDMYNDLVVSGVPKFRYSSFKILWDKMQSGTDSQKNYTPVGNFVSEWNKIKRIAMSSDNNGDQDNLIGYVEEFLDDYEKKNCWVRLDYALKRADPIEFSDVMRYIQENLNPEDLLRAINTLVELLEKHIGKSSYRTVNLESVHILKNARYIQVKTDKPVRIYINNKACRLAFKAAEICGHEHVHLLMPYLHPIEQIYFTYVRYESEEIQMDTSAVFAYSAGLIRTPFACSYKASLGVKAYSSDPVENDKIVMNIYSLLDFNPGSPSSWILGWSINPLDVHRLLLISDPPPKWVVNNIKLLSEMSKTIRDIGYDIVDAFDPEWLNKKIEFCDYMD